jgi:hypothetical protein
MTDESGVHMYVNRFDVDGAATGSAIDHGTGRWPNLVWTGSEYGMCWIDGATSTAQTRFMILSADATERVASFRVDGTLGNNYEARVSWTGSRYGVFWRHGATDLDIHFNLITPEGSVAPTEVHSVENTHASMQPRPAWSGSEFGIGWSDDRHGSNQPYFVRLDPDGIAIGTDIRISLHGGTGNLDSLVWTGSEYAAAWTESTTGLFVGYFNTISPTGVVTGTEMTLTDSTSNAHGVFMAWTGSELGLVYRDDADDDYDIMFNRIGFCD